MTSRIETPDPHINLLREALEKAARQFDFAGQKFLPANRLLAVGCFKAAEDIRAALSATAGKP